MILYDFPSVSKRPFYHVIVMLKSLLCSLTAACIIVLFCLPVRVCFENADPAVTQISLNEEYGANDQNMKTINLCCGNKKYRKKQ